MNRAGALGRGIGMPTGRLVGRARARRIEDLPTYLFDGQTKINIVQTIVEQRIKAAERAKQFPRNEKGKFPRGEFALLQSAAKLLRQEAVKRKWALIDVKGGTDMPQQPIVVHHLATDNTNCGFLLRHFEQPVKPTRFWIQAGL